ncbi:dihydroxy-acid dehydratase, partial [Flavobacteriaceae bacterium]|nr:dihydroxy-acid dehydratase [Flavobacteriaceae bacterium]
GGEIALIEEGDSIEIDIPNRKIDVIVSDAELRVRKEILLTRLRKFKPEKSRPRKISTALKLYAKHVTNASLGAVREELD